MPDAGTGTPRALVRARPEVVHLTDLAAGQEGQIEERALTRLALRREMRALAEAA